MQTVPLSRVLPGCEIGFLFDIRLVVERVSQAEDLLGRWSLRVEGRPIYRGTLPAATVQTPGSNVPTAGVESASILNEHELNCSTET